jgi:DNA-binding transcriptional LysR family regulator
VSSIAAAILTVCSNMDDISLPFDLRSLAVFLAVCDNETISGAARSLGLTQSAVSQVISELEQKLRTTLFDRQVRPLGLTLGGVALRERARALIADAQQIVPLLKQVTKGTLPLVRVGLISSFTRLLVPALSTFLLKYSDHVSFLSGFTASHMEDVAQRRLEIAVGVDEFDVPNDLETWPVLEEPYILVVPANTPPIATLEDMMKLSKTLHFVRYNPRRKIAVAIDRHLRRIGLNPPRTLEFDTPYPVAASVACGNCWAITTPLLVYETLSVVDHIRCVSIPGPGLRRRISLIARSRELGNVPREAAGFICNLLRERCIPALAPHIDTTKRAIVVGSDDKQAY